MDQNSSGCPPIRPGYGVGMLPGNKAKGSVEKKPVTDQVGLFSHEKRCIGIETAGLSFMPWK